MALVPVESYSLVCDRCGTRYESGDYSIFGDGWEPRHEAHHEGGWWCDGEHDAPDERGPAGRDLCYRCTGREWVDDDTVLLYTEHPIPEPHVFVRRWPGHSFSPPGEQCNAVGCNLRRDHQVHTGQREETRD